MNAALTIAAIVSGPLVLALLFALWDDSFSARHKRHVANLERMSRETDAYCAAVRAESEAIRAETDKRLAAWLFEQSWGWRPRGARR